MQDGRGSVRRGIGQVKRLRRRSVGFEQEGPGGSRSSGRSAGSGGPQLRAPPDRAAGTTAGQQRAPRGRTDRSRQPILKIEPDPIGLRAAHASMRPPPTNGPTCPHACGSRARGDSARQSHSAGRSRPDPRQQPAGHRRGRDAGGSRSGAGGPARLDPRRAGDGGPARRPDTRPAACSIAPLHAGADRSLGRGPARCSDSVLWRLPPTRRSTGSTRTVSAC